MSKTWKSRVYGAVLAPLLLAAAAGGAPATEVEVTFEVAGQTVVGTLETPDGVSPAPVVLMLHGFTGTRDELPVKDTEEGVFSRTARILAENGYASLRIDFRGSGDSGGAWPETTFSGQIADAVVAIDWLKSDKRVDGSNISVLGWSQGGLVAAHAAATRPDVKSVVLWAAVTNPLATYSDLLGKDNVDTALAGPADASTTIKLPWGAETTLNGSFFHELPTTSPAGAIAGYPGPLLVIVGSKDTLVKPQPAAGQILLDYHPGTEKLIEFDTDHVWDAFVGPETLDSKMLPATMEWLRSHK